MEQYDELKLDAGACIGRGIEVYFQRFGLFGSLTLLLILERFLITFYRENQNTLFLKYPELMSLTVCLILFITVYFTLIAHVMILLGAEAVETESEMSFGELFRGAHASAWRYLGWNVLLVAMYFPIWVLPTLLSGTIEMNGWLTELIFLVGSFLSLGGHTLFSFAPIMSVIDGNQSKHLSLSRQLMGHHFWRVFWILGLAVFYNYAVRLIQMIPMVMELPSVILTIFSVLGIVLQNWLVVITLMALYYAYDTIKELNNAEE